MMSALTRGQRPEVRAADRIGGKPRATRQVTIPAAAARPKYARRKRPGPQARTSSLPNQKRPSAPEDQAEGVELEERPGDEPPDLPVEHARSE